MVDVVAVGELLIDFTYVGTSDAGQPLYEANPGGAPANVLVTVSRLGGHGAFIGKVGNDAFGSQLVQTLKDCRIDMRGCVVSPEFNTTLAFVQLADSGERTFTFFRRHGADAHLRGDDLQLRVIEEAKVLHFGSVSLTTNPARTATFAAVEYARELGKTISFDCNLRTLLWDSMAEAKSQILKAVALADILKVSQEELEFITGRTNLEEGLHVLWREYRTPLILVTLGHQGSVYHLFSDRGRVPAMTVASVDTTGAGDAFTGAVLYQLATANKAPSDLTAAEVESYLRLANAVGALVTTKRGAIPSIPNQSEVQAFLARCAGTHER